MTNKNYNFRDSLATGKIAVDWVVNLLKKQPIHKDITSVEDNPTYRGMGMDLLWLVNDNGRDRIVTIEVKADTYFDTGNLFLETVSNMSKGTPGCFLSSRADVYAYFFVGVDVLYWIPLKKAQAWLTINYQRFPERITSTGRGTKHFYKTKGVLVPRMVMLQEVYGTKEIRI